MRRPDFSFAPAPSAGGGGTDALTHPTEALIRDCGGRRRAGRVCGYSAYSLKRDPGVRLHGYLFSHGVNAGHRRRDIATRLLHHAHARPRTRKMSGSCNTPDRRVMPGVSWLLVTIQLSMN